MTQSKYILIHSLLNGEIEKKYSIKKIIKKSRVNLANL
jgi:hypothetical protein